MFGPVLRRFYYLRSNFRVRDRKLFNKKCLFFSFGVSSMNQKLCSHVLFIAHFLLNGPDLRREIFGSFYTSPITLNVLFGPQNGIAVFEEYQTSTRLIICVPWPICNHIKPNISLKGPFLSKFTHFTPLFGNLLSQP